MGVTALIVGASLNLLLLCLTFRTVGAGVLPDFIREWQSPNSHLAWQQPFILLLLTVLALSRSGRRADFTDLALLAAWTIWALLAGRNIAIFVIVTVPIFVRYGTAAWAHLLLWAASRPMAGGRTPSILNWLLLILVAIAALMKVCFPPAGIWDNGQSNPRFTAGRRCRLCASSAPCGPYV